MLETIRTLVETYGPSGHEGQIRETIIDMIEDLADDIQVDAMGNVIAWKLSGEENAPRIMLSTHMDEIGVIVTLVDEDGFLRFTSIGSLLAVTLTGQRVLFADGTIGSIYVEGRSNTSTVPSLSQLYIDVSDGESKRSSIGVGDAGSLYRLMDVRGKHLIAKSMDNRISCAMQIEIMRRLEYSPNDIAFVFSVQEEVGERGAQTAAYTVDPDIGIAIDVTMTGDTPKRRNLEVSLGKGPAIKIKDSKMIADPDIIKLMEKAAKKAKVPYQREVLVGGTTEASAMQLVRAGVKAGCLSIPCRYVHTTSETVHYDDVESGVELLTTLLSERIKL